MFVFVSVMYLIEGVVGKFCVEIFSCIKMNSVIEEDKIVVNHVDVSSCGISLWKKFVFSNFNLKG